MDDDEFDVDELENAEYDEDSQFQPYTGPMPPNNTLLTGRIKKAWWTFTASDDRMMKVVWEADEYAGKYKTMGVWDNITFNAKSKWRWYPFLQAFGLTLNDVKKKMFVVGDEDDPNLGAPIEKIGKWVPGEESADVRIITTNKRDNGGEMRVNVVKYLPYEDEDEEDDDYEDDEDDEEEEQPPPTRRVRAPAAKSAATSKAGAAKRRAAPEPVEDEDEDEPEEDEDQEEEAAPERPAKRRAAKPGTATAAARSGRPVPARSAARTGKVAGKRPRRATSQGSDEEPPF
jgi:hypothetical protein